MAKQFRPLKQGRRQCRQAVWLAGLLLGMAVRGMVLAAETGGAVAPKDGDPLESFVRQLNSEQRTRIAPIVQAAKTNAEVRQTAMLEAMLALNPDLTRAVGLLNEGQSAEALKLLDPLTGAQDLFLAKHAAWFRIQGLISQERYEEALAALPAVQADAARYTQLVGEMSYTEGLLRAYLLDRAAAAAALRRYLAEYPQAPPERRGSAQGVLDEIEGAKSNTLPEAITLMNDSRRRLHLSDSGDLTQTRQRQIVDILDKIIEELEKQKGSGSSSGSGSGGGEGGQGGGGPAAVSAGKGAGTGIKLGLSSETGDPDSWAKAYKRDRETVQRELQTRFPERYRELIEQYYRSLSSGGTTEKEGPK